VAEHIVAALPDLCDDVRILVAHHAVEQDRGRQFELIEDFEQAPVADAVAVVAPGEVARGLRTGAIARIHSDAGAEGEMLDVERDVEREPFSLGPAVVGALHDRHEAVAGMARKLQHSSSPLSCRPPARRLLWFSQNPAYRHADRTSDGVW